MSLQDMNIQQEPSVKSRPTSKYGVQQQLQPKTEQKQSPVVKVPQSQSQDLKKKKSCIIS